MDKCQYMIFRATTVCIAVQSFIVVTLFTIGFANYVDSYNTQNRKLFNNIISVNASWDAKNDTEI